MIEPKDWLKFKNGVEILKYSGFDNPVVGLPGLFGQIIHRYSLFTTLISQNPHFYAKNIKLPNEPILIRLPPENLFLKGYI